MFRIIIGLLLVLFTQDAFSQVQMRMDDTAAKGENADTVNVLLFATRARDITSFAFPVSFDQDSLEYVGNINSFDTDLIIDESQSLNGQLSVSWSDETLMGLGSFRQEFVELRFVIKSQCRVNTPITFTGNIITPVTLKLDNNGDIVPATTTYFDGLVKTECVRGLFDVSNEVIGDIETVEVSINVEDLEGIIGLDFRLKYDTAKLEFVTLSNSHFDAGVNFNNVDGEIIYFWNDNDLTKRDLIERTLLATLSFKNKMTCGELADIEILESAVAALEGVIIHSEFPVNSEGSVSVSCTPIANIDIQSVDCFGASTGAILLDVSSGTPPYSYEWSNGALTKDIIQIPAETYSVTITDSNNGEIVYDNIEVTQNDEINGDVTMNADCQAGEVSVSLDISGGAEPYEILWSDASTGSPIVITTLPVTLTVTITDNLSCTKEYTNISVDALDNIGLSVETSNIRCFGAADGSIVLIPEGGVEPYMYAWVGPNGFEATTKDISELEAGMYSVRVEDANGCSGLLTEEILSPENGITLSIDTESASGGNDNGRATVIVTGGEMPYSYEWSCTDQTLAIVDGLAAGDCCVTVTDDFDCQTEMCFEILVGTNEIDGIISYSIYPNPTMNVLNIEIEMKIAENLHFEIINSLGQVVYRNSKVNINYINERIATELWPQGSYTLKVFNDSNKTLTQGIIKM